MPTDPVRRRGATPRSTPPSCRSDETPVLFTPDVLAARPDRAGLRAARRATARRPPLWIAVRGAGSQATTSTPAALLAATACWRSGRWSWASSATSSRRWTRSTRATARPPPTGGRRAPTADRCGGPRPPEAEPPGRGGRRHRRCTGRSRAGATAEGGAGLPAGRRRRRHDRGLHPRRRRRAPAAATPADAGRRRPARRPRPGRHRRPPAGARRRAAGRCSGCAPSRARACPRSARCAGSGSTPPTSSRWRRRRPEFLGLGTGMPPPGAGAGPPPVVPGSAARRGRGAGPVDAGGRWSTSSPRAAARPPPTARRRGRAVRFGDGVRGRTLRIGQRIRAARLPLRRRRRRATSPRGRSPSVGACRGVKVDEPAADRRRRGRRDDRRGARADPRRAAPARPRRHRAATSASWRRSRASGGAPSACPGSIRATKSTEARRRRDGRRLAARGPAPPRRAGARRDAAARGVPLARRAPAGHHRAATSSRRPTGRSRWRSGWR